MKPAFLTLLIPLALCLSPFCSADEIVYQVSAVASGSLGGSSFNNQLVTISGVGDTEDVQMDGGVNFLLQGFVASVEIDGLGSATFTDAIQAVSNNNTDLGGFGNNSNNTALFFVFNSAFEDYDLTTELAPVSGTAVISVNSHQTDAGSFVISNVAGMATFEASLTAIPEPSTISVLFGAALVPLLRRRREV